MKNILLGPRWSAAALIFCGLALGANAEAQITLLFTPETAKTSRALGIRGAAMWTVRACNDSAGQVTLAPERMFMAAPELTILDHTAAAAMLARSRATAARTRIARLIETAITMSSIFAAGGLFSSGARVAVSLAMGATGARQLADFLQGTVPDLTPFASALMDSPVALAPGGCATRIVIGVERKDAKPVAARLP